MNNFELAIQAVPSRFRFHLDMMKKVPYAHLIIDTKQEGHFFDTFKACLAKADMSKPYVVVVQDDLDFCVNFTETVEKIIASAITEFGEALPLVGLYCPRSSTKELKGTGKNFISMIGGSWGQANMYPTSWIKGFMEFSDLMFAPEYDSDDGRLTFWSAVTKTPWWVTAPSLVQHLGATVSTIGFSNKNKVASWYAGEESPLSFDWSFKDCPRQSIVSLKTLVQIRHKSNTFSDYARDLYGLGIYGDGTIRSS